MRLSKTLYLLAILAVSLSGCNTGNTNKGTANPEEDSTIAHTTDTVKEIIQPLPHEEVGIQYKTYNNDTYNFSIDYPLGILIPQGESGSGDGQVFKSKDEKCTLWVYRDFRDNMSETSYNLKSAYQDDIRKDNPNHPKREITYSRASKDFYVISGTEGNKIFYQKTIMKNNQLVTFLLEHKKSEKEEYQLITEHISRSFH